MARPGEAFLAFVVKILTIGSLCVGAALVAAGCLLQVGERERELKRVRGRAAARAPAPASSRAPTIHRRTHARSRPTPLSLHTPTPSLSLSLPQNPPRAPVPAGLVAVGVLTAASAALGFVGVGRSRALLAAYVGAGAAATLAQAALVGAAFADPARVCAEIAAANTHPGLAPALDRAALEARLAAFRWMFVWVALAQAGGLALAGGLFALSKRGAGWEYDGMAPDTAHAAHLAVIRSVGDLKGAARQAGRGVARLAARMEQRYGAAAAAGGGGAVGVG